MNICREKYLLGESVFEHPSCQSQAPSVHLFSKLPAAISVPVYLSWRAPPLLPQVQARVMVWPSAWDRRRTVLPLLVPGFKNGQ